MTRSRGFDALYQQLVNALRSNQKAHSKLAADDVQAVTQRETSQVQARRKWEIGSQEQEDRLNSLLQRLKEGHAIRHGVGLILDEVQASDVNHVMHLSPREGWEQTQRQVDTLFAALQSAWLHLQRVREEIEERKRIQRRRIQIAIGTPVLIIVGTIFAFVASTEPQRQAAMAATATVVGYVTATQAVFIINRDWTGIGHQSGFSPYTDSYIEFSSVQNGELRGVIGMDYRGLHRATIEGEYYLSLPGATNPADWNNLTNTSRGAVLWLRWYTRRSLGGNFLINVRYVAVISNDGQMLVETYDAEVGGRKIVDWTFTAS